MHDHDRGLEFDLGTLRSRRTALGLFGGAGLALLAGCTGTPSEPSPASTTGAVTGVLEEIPRETAGPFPGNGSNGPNVLAESGIVRADITRSFGSAAGVADGVPLRIELTIIEADTEGVRPGAAVYVWHCDRNGDYSMYSEAIAGENYLRGVQEADDFGLVGFDSIFPAAYPGRWPHVHFEVYPSLAEATSAGGKLTTTQLALPKDVCETIYATEDYAASARHLAETSLESDNVFGDGWDTQLATVTGDLTTGYVATLTVPV